MNSARRENIEITQVTRSRNWLIKLPLSWDYASIGVPRQGGFKTDGGLIVKIKTPAIADSMAASLAF